MDRSGGAFSTFVSETMDNMGYDHNMVQHRRDMCKNMLDDKNFIVAGSKGEGITRFLENDIDSMLVYSNVECSENVCYLHESNSIFLQMDRHPCAPGYTRLLSAFDIPNEHSSNELFNRGIPFGYVTHSLVEKPIIEVTSGLNFGKKGPSFYLDPLIGASSDNVPSLKCDCPSILTSWVSRRRTNDWPSQQTIAEVSTLDAHVVTAGYKHSPHKNIEWRICYTLAELALIHSLNDTQLKMYVLLKFIAKSALKPVCEAMTSYVMKNIVLWVCENTTSSLFTPRLLVDRLLQCLKIIRFLVRHRSIPSFMIPERNLFIERKVPGQQKRLLSLLSELIDEGPCMLFRSDKLRLAMVKMYTAPEAIGQECMKRNQLERLMLLSVHCLKKLMAPVYPDKGVLEIMSELLQQCYGSACFLHVMKQAIEVVLPDLEFVEDSGETLVELVRRLLS